MLTYVMAVYGQPKMLNYWWETLGSYPDDVSERISLIVVDDHGDPPATIPEAIRTRFSAKLFRVLDDIPWNQMGARNLGMHHARGWCVMLDPDMVIGQLMAKRFLDTELKRGEVVRFGLKHMNGSQDGVDMSSPNTYLIHRDDFFNAGGYDEDYAGNKGWSDVQMLQVLTEHYKMHLRSDLWVQFYDTGAFDDAQVVTLDRSVKVNKAIHLRKRAEAKRGGWVKWVLRQKGNLNKPQLRFRWEQVF
jgi:hypothetical protein